MKSLRRPLIVSLCAALLVVRIGGVHLHLHAADHEVPSEIHLADAGLHDEHHEHEAPTAAHADVEIQFDNLLAKTKTGFDAPVLLAALILCGLFWISARSTPRRYVESFTPLPLPFLRPPLRGPPVHS